MLARRKSGFTLIELLVVIAIIAILAAILFPVFARARETARKSNCSNNIKECSVAVQLYYNDYDSTLPAAVSGSDNDTVAYCTGNGSYPLPPAAGAARVTWAQKVFDYMKSKEIMFCPSDGSKDSYPNATGLSYWWKTAANVAWWAPLNPARKEGEFAYGSDQIILYEHAGFHSGEVGVKGGTQINVAFLDTHVKTASLPADDTDPLIAATGIMAAGEPMYYNYDFEGNNGTGADLAKGKNADPRRMGDKL